MIVLLRSVPRLIRASLYIYPSTYLVQQFFTNLLLPFSHAGRSLFLFCLRRRGELGFLARRSSCLILPQDSCFSTKLHQIRTPMTRHILGFIFILFFSSCENTNIPLITGAATDAVTALTLSDEAVRDLATRAAYVADSQNLVAPTESSYDKRLQVLLGKYSEMQPYTLSWSEKLKQSTQFSLASFRTIISGRDMALYIFFAIRTS